MNNAKDQVLDENEGQNSDFDEWDQYDSDGENEEPQQGKEGNVREYEEEEENVDEQPQQRQYYSKDNQIEQGDPQHNDYNRYNAGYSNQQYQRPYQGRSKYENRGNYNQHPHQQHQSYQNQNQSRKYETAYDNEGNYYQGKRGYDNRNNYSHQDNPNYNDANYYDGYKKFPKKQRPYQDDNLREQGNYNYSNKPNHYNNNPYHNPHSGYNEIYHKDRVEGSEKEPIVNQNTYFTKKKEGREGRRYQNSSQQGGQINRYPQSNYKSNPNDNNPHYEPNDKERASGEEIKTPFFFNSKKEVQAPKEKEEETEASQIKPIVTDQPKPIDKQPHHMKIGDILQTDKLSSVIELTIQNKIQFVKENISKNLEKEYGPLNIHAKQYVPKNKSNVKSLNYA